MDLFVDRRPIFTIGQIWFDFAKRLPPPRPRFRTNMSAAEAAYQSSLAQASEAQLSALAQQLNAQQCSPYGQPRQPWWGPIGSGLGDPFHP